MKDTMKKRTFVSAIGLVLVCLSACKGDPKATARDLVAKGDQQLAQKKVAEAIIEYRRAVQADPRLGQARLKLADAYAQSGDGPNAYREYVRAAELLPDDKDAQIKAGAVMLMASQFQDAQGIGQKMLAKDP